MQKTGRPKTDPVQTSSASSHIDDYTRIKSREDSHNLPLSEPIPVPAVNIKDQEAAHQNEEQTRVDSASVASETTRRTKADHFDHDVQMMDLFDTAGGSGETEGRTQRSSDTIPEEEESRRIIEAKKALDDIEWDIRKCKDRIASLEQWNHNLELENRKQEDLGKQEAHNLEDQRRVLNASRAFTAKENTLDAQALIQPLGDLNSSISDFAFEVLRGLDEAADEQRIKPQHYMALRRRIQDPSIETFLNEISRREEMTVMDIIDPLVRAMLCAHLWRGVFHPFLPGADEDLHTLFSTLYRRMLEDEGQERCAHWRSLTYAYASIPEADAFLTRENDRFTNTLSDVLKILMDQEEAGLTPELRDSALKVFEAAVKVQRKAKVEYMSFDYVVNLPFPGDHFNDKQMTVAQPGDAKPRTVWLAIGMGMSASRNVRNRDGRIESERDFAVKAQVICDNWDSNA